MRSKHRHLLNDPDVKRWCENVARGSIITADERLRRLGRFCEVTNLNPKAIVERKRNSPSGFDDFIMDYVEKSLVKARSLLRRGTIS